MTLKIDEQKLKELYSSSVDFMLGSDLFSSICRLHYPPRKESCPNVIGNNNHFGCLECGGNGYKFTETIEEVRLRVHFGGRLSFNKNAFRKLGLDIESPQGDALILGYMTDAPKVSACNYLQFFNDIEHHHWKFKLLSAPLPYSFCKDRYFYAYLRREDHI